MGGSGRKMPPKVHGPQHKPGQRSGQLQPRGAGVAQTKTAAASQSKRPPAAPPVYRPQPAPAVLQSKKTAGPATPVAASVGDKRPVAPPVYKPQRPPAALQRKPANAGVQPNPTKGAAPTPPPVYHPQPVPRVLQLKTSHRAAGEPGGRTNAKPPAAPAVYRPQPTPKVLQAKEATPGRNIVANPARTKPVAPAAYRPDHGPRTVQRYGSAGRTGGAARAVIQCKTLVYTYLYGLKQSNRTEEYWAQIKGFKKVSTGAGEVWVDERNVDSLLQEYGKGGGQVSPSVVHAPQPLSSAASSPVVSKLAQHLKLAQEAVDYVRRVVGIRSANKDDEQEKAKASDISNVFDEYNEDYRNTLAERRAPIEKLRAQKVEASKAKVSERLKIYRTPLPQRSDSQNQAVKLLGEEIGKLDSAVKELDKELEAAGDESLWIQVKARAAIKHKAGNCEEQAAVAFNYLRGKVSPLELVNAVDDEALGINHQFVVIGREGKSTDPTKFGPNAVICDPWDGKAYPASEFRQKMHKVGRSETVSFAYSI